MSDAVNPFRGQVALKLNDVDYALVFDVNALCFAERELGLSTDEIIDRQFGRSPSLDVTRVLLWAGMQERHAITVHQVGQLLSAGGKPALVAARNAIVEGMRAAFGPAKEGKKAGDPPKGGEAGSGSPS